jgi:uncharacterized protein (TIGR02266 family)
MPATALVVAKTVVVADDTAFVCDRFRTALAAAGHRVITLRTAGDLLAILRDEASQIDLVVADLRLPQGHGVELVKAIRRIQTFKAPLIVFSGTIANADEVRALADLGVTGYVNEYTAVQHILPALSPHLYPEQHNRRSSPRVVLGVPVAYRFGNTIAGAVTLNISRGGLAVRTTSPLELNTVVRARFRLPGVKKEIEAEARVAWIDRRIGMGLDFTSIAEADERALDEFIRSHFFSNRKA